jgi:hypothetical protein
MTQDSEYFSSFFSNRAEYVLGLDNPLTQKLGEVYVKCLDAPKAGTVLFLQSFKSSKFLHFTKQILFFLKRDSTESYSRSSPQERV